MRVKAKDLKKGDILTATNRVVDSDAYGVGNKVSIVVSGRRYEWNKNTIINIK